MKCDASNTDRQHEMKTNEFTFTRIHDIHETSLVRRDETWKLFPEYRFLANENSAAL